MAKEDVSLRVEMGKLEIEPSKINKNNKFINLSQQKKFNATKNLQNYKICACTSQKKNRNVTICKKKHRILKEPILKLPQSYKNDYQIYNKDANPSVLNKVSSPDTLNLHALVDTCNQLSISAENNVRNKATAQSDDNIEWWRSNAGHDKQHSKGFCSEKSQSSSCSQQALNPQCDVTIDELASYFETLVHIPKKMSSMAEMMYI